MATDDEPKHGSVRGVRKMLTLCSTAMGDRAARDRLSPLMRPASAR